jgi:ATP-dependent DNA helicase DinG
MAFNDITLKHAPREAQVTMRDFFAQNVKDDVKFTLIDSPVGTGKSFGAVLMMDWYRREVQGTAKYDVLTNSKLLQEQYTRDFGFMNSLWGKANYACDRFSCDCGTAKPLAKSSGVKCEDCPYDEARNSFFNGQVSLTNFHLFVTYMVHSPQAWKRVRSAKVLIIDEAHEFESVFCDFITNKLSKFALKRYGLSETEAAKVAKRFFGITEIAAYAQAVEDELLPVLRKQANELNASMRGASEEQKKKLASQLDALKKQADTWVMFLAEYEDLPGNWVLERDAQRNGNYETSVQPVWAYPYLQKYVWSQYDHVVLMSGTILDMELFCFMNALPVERTRYLSIPSPFPVENRPIYYFPIGKMNYANKDVTYAKQEPYIERILQKHSADKGIIHTFTYENMNRVVNGIPDKRLLHHESATRTAVLERHMASKEPTVLVSPSMMVGVDLKEELSRFQIIMKVPYPSLGSEKVKRRMATNDRWYSWVTVCNIIQSYGRSIRSDTDRAETYILDACFGDIERWSSRLLPQYVKDAITRVDIR